MLATHIVGKYLNHLDSYFSPIEYSRMQNGTGPVRISTHFLWVIHSLDG